MDPLNPLLAIALIFIAGYLAGLAARRLGLPSVTGNILVGVILGPSVLKIFDTTTAHSLEPINQFVMGLITIAIGGHLNYRRLHNAKRRILCVAFCEVALTTILVTAGALMVGAPLETALLLGAIASATAPATVLTVIREEKAKGLLVKTLLATVALDNMCCIVLFSIASILVSHLGETDPSIWAAIGLPLRDLLLSSLLGLAIGGALLWAVRRRKIEPFSGLIIAILLITGGAEYGDISSLMASLVLGIMVGNSGRESEGLVTSLESLQPILLTCFFTLAGVDLDVRQLGVMGLLGAVYFATRAVGKIGGAGMGAWIGATLPRIRRHLGIALLPQAGLAIGLLVVLQSEGRVAEAQVVTITNVILATVILNELLGPPLVRRAVTGAGEAGMDRRRIVEFLQEEYIRTPLEAENRWDAIRQLAEFLIKSHGLKNVDVDELIESVEGREREFTTAIGQGVALPHARLDAGPEIMGVMGISPKGLDFGAPDGEPVHLIIMIATPKEHHALHAEVLAAVARIMSDPRVRARLFTARNPAEAYEAIDTNIRQDYNYFLED